MKQTIKNLINGFQQHLANKGKADNTQVNYVYDIQTMATKLGWDTKDDLGKVTTEELYRSIFDDRVSYKTRQRRLSSGRAFFNFANVNPNPFYELKDIYTGKQYTTSYFSIEEVDTILDHSHYQLSLRDQVIISLVYFEGLSLEEISSLQTKDCSTTLISIKSNKNQPAEIVEISLDTATLWTEYYTYRKSVDTIQSDVFFLSKKSKYHFGRKSMWRIFDTYLKDIGLYKPGRSINTLRTSRMVHLRLQDHNYTEIRELMRLTNDSNTRDMIKARATAHHLELKDNYA